MTGREELVRRVLEALAWPCEACSTAIRIVLENPHDRHAFDRAAEALGLQNRRALERRMRRDGFPALNQFQAWLRLLVLLDVWERDGRSLQDQVYACDEEPSVAFRAVTRVTGTTWHEAQQQGLHVGLTRFAKEIGTHLHCTPR